MPHFTITTKTAIGFNNYNPMDEVKHIAELLIIATAILCIIFQPYIAHLFNSCKLWQR